MKNAESASESVQRVYAERFATDLADNRTEQKELTAQIERLRARLEQLRTDETWLDGMQAALPGAAAPPGQRRAARTAGKAAGAGRRTAGDTRSDTDARAGTGSRTTDATPAGDGTRAGDGTTPAATPVPKPRPAARAKARPARSRTSGTKTTAAATPLHQLIRSLMPPGEPRMVREVHADLAKAHPERGTSVQVVRNTLETLVKRGAVDKGLQQGAAMYTVPAPAASGDSDGDGPDTAAD